MLSEKKIRFLFKRLHNVQLKLERANLAAFIQLLENPARLILLNFIAGLARGFGIAIGLTIIAGLFLLSLTRLAELNLPVIGRWIAELVRIVNKHLLNYY